MQVDEKTVRHIAKLARIKVSDAEAKTLKGESGGFWPGSSSSMR